MKKLILLITLLLTISLSSQNTFPNSGNVGIGTTSPDAKLAIKGNLKVGGFTLNNGGYDDNYGHVTKIIDHTSYNNYILGWDWETKLGDHTLIGWGGYGEGDELIISEYKGLLWPNNVGIGTVNPLEKVHIEKGALQFINYGNVEIADIIKIGKDLNTPNQFSIQGLFAGQGAIGNFFKLRTIWNDNSLVLRGDGNIGIGISNPDAKLAVNGRIHTKEVKVDMSGWPDYVFEKEYKLLALKEVENHIVNKGYLPEMPSAEEVENKGLELGLISKKLLQKIEELTLYAISQEKRIKNQETELSKEKEKYKFLEERLEKIEKLLIEKKE
ncbi:hypothetical protein [Tenacibaculum soleae]|uniref:hypothetical protein n=1 Tax=Tenacibaculum soleae TaxID=447689 RepID=UPI0026E169BC|nr:hypothetical protein [Tenacibaculum soleae]MDO6812239.1 hypothetical protein [Tenacibaculum soleae]